MGIFTPTFRSKFAALLEKLPLSQYEKDFINSHYVDIVEAAEYEYAWTYILYMLLTNLIAVAGVLITAFISLEKLDWISPAASRNLFWVVWALSVAITLSDKWLYSSNIPKKYILGEATLEKLYNEGWSFLAGIDAYASSDDKFKLFCSRIGIIKLLSVANNPDMGGSDTANSILAAGPENHTTRNPQEMIDIGL